MIHAGFTGTQVGCKAPQVESLARVVRAVASYADDALTFHHGDCIGGDATLHGVVRELGHRIELHPPLNWSKRAWCTLRGGEVAHEPDEYIPRNHAIVDATSLLVATPREETGEELRSGTWATVRYARKLKRLIVIVRPSGLIETPEVVGGSTDTASMREWLLAALA